MPEEPKEIRNHSVQLNFRLSREEYETLREVARELDFGHCTLARRIIKQFIKEHLAKKASHLAAQN